MKYLNDGEGRADERGEWRTRKRFRDRAGCWGREEKLGEGGRKIEAEEWQYERTRERWTEQKGEGKVGISQQGNHLVTVFGLWQTLPSLLDVIMTVCTETCDTEDLLVF